MLAWDLAVHRWLLRSAAVFDVLLGRWDSHAWQRASGNLLILTYVGALVCIEASRRQWLPAPLAALVPVNHFYAVEVAFTLLLVLEVVGLILGLARSVAQSLGIQFEIFSLILLRQTFKEFTHFTEPIAWAEVEGSLPHMASDALGAVVVFAVVAWYYRLQRHQPITSPDERTSFVAAKKSLALLLLVVLVGIAVDDLWRWGTEQHVYQFFEVFYTVLIFSDVLIVLLSLRYSSTYRMVFRNSGFAVATVFLRLALAAPPIVNAAMGVGAVGLACGLTVIYNWLQGTEMHGEVAPTAS